MLPLYGSCLILIANLDELTTASPRLNLSARLLAHASPNPFSAASLFRLASGFTSIQKYDNMGQHMDDLIQVLDQPCDSIPFPLGTCGKALPALCTFDCTLG